MRRPNCHKCGEDLIDVVGPLSSIYGLICPRCEAKYNLVEQPRTYKLVEVED
jgi:hypothetical protein